MNMILKTKNLCKSFNGQTAVNNISLNIERNSVYGLLGPNGAGKSTTLKMITGILRPTSGSIEFDGHAWKRSDLNHVDDWMIAKLLGHTSIYSVHHYRKIGNKLMADETRAAREKMDMILLDIIEGWDDYEI